jgi:hypothetical protein
VAFGGSKCQNIKRCCFELNTSYDVIRPKYTILEVLTTVVLHVIIFCIMREYCSLYVNGLISLLKNYANVFRVPSETS